MKVKDIVYKLQTPGRGSSYQDEKMLEDFIAEEIVKATAELRSKNAELSRLNDQQGKKIHRLEDELDNLKTDRHE